MYDDVIKHMMFYDVIIFPLDSGLYKQYRILYFSDYPLFEVCNEQCEQAELECILECSSDQGCIRDCIRVQDQCQESKYKCYYL